MTPASRVAACSMPAQKLCGASSTAASSNKRLMVMPPRVIGTEWKPVDANA
jgi:hypothetical protein